jgi:hypothetical protein
MSSRGEGVLESRVIFPAIYEALPYSSVEDGKPPEAEGMPTTYTAETLDPKLPVSVLLQNANSYESINCLQPQACVDNQKGKRVISLAGRAPGVNV